MGIMIIRLGSPRITGEGLRIGTAAPAERRAEERVCITEFLRCVAAQSGSQRRAHQGRTVCHK